MHLYKRNKKQNHHIVIIFSDDSIVSENKYQIDIHSNIITIMDLFKRYFIGTVHTVFVQYSKKRLEASVSFHKNSTLCNNRGIYQKPVLIPKTNVFIQII